MFVAVAKLAFANCRGFPITIPVQFFKTSSGLVDLGGRSEVVVLEALRMQPDIAFSAPPLSSANYVNHIIFTVFIFREIFTCRGTSCRPASGQEDHSQQSGGPCHHAGWSLQQLPCDLVKIFQFYVFLNKEIICNL